MGGDPLTSLQQLRLPYFNSHPRMGGDPSLKEEICNERISIRTPAWGVTGVFKDFHLTREISIRTPAWGVTFRTFTLCPFTEFQFAPPHGG